MIYFVQHKEHTVKEKNLLRGIRGIQPIINLHPLENLSQLVGNSSHQSVIKTVTKTVTVIHNLLEILISWDEGGS